MYNKCRTCEYFEPMEGEEMGVCSFLSSFDFESESGAGAEGEFFCSPDWGCNSHSSADSEDTEGTQGQTAGQPSGQRQQSSNTGSQSQRNNNQQRGQRRRASDYL